MRRSGGLLLVVLFFGLITVASAAVAARRPPEKPVARVPAGPTPSSNGVEATPGPSPATSAAPSASPSPSSRPAPTPAAATPAAPPSVVSACSASQLNLRATTAANTYHRGDTVVIRGSAANRSAITCRITLDTCTDERAGVFDVRGALIWRSPATGCPAPIGRDLAPGGTVSVTFAYLANTHGNFTASVAWKLAGGTATSTPAAFRVD